MKIEEFIYDVPDFPKEGILFKDITPLLQNGAAFKEAILQMSKIAMELGADVIVGPESRGFIFGCPIATEIGKGFVPVRKPNKLPRDVITESYELEYGSDTLCMHKDGIKQGQKVVIVDDLLATGGTIKAITKMIEKSGGIVAGVVVLIDLKDLNGKELLNDYKVISLLTY